MVLVKMLMDIDPLPMRGSMVMMMVMISPSWRDVSPAEQLCRIPRLVPPRFHLETAALHPESFLLIFFPGRKTSYSQRWTPEACHGAHETGGPAQGVGRAPTLVDGGWPPYSAFFVQYFLCIPKLISAEFHPVSLIMIFSRMKDFI